MLVGYLLGTLQHDHFLLQLRLGWRSQRTIKSKRDERTDYRARFVARKNSDYECWTICLSGKFDEWNLSCSFKCYWATAGWRLCILVSRSVKRPDTFSLHHFVSMALYSLLKTNGFLRNHTVHVSNSKVSLRLRGFSRRLHYFQIWAQWLRKHSGKPHWKP